MSGFRWRRVKYSFKIIIGLLTLVSTSLYFSALEMSVTAGTASAVITNLVPLIASLTLALLGLYFLWTGIGKLVNSLRGYNYHKYRKYTKSTLGALICISALLLGYSHASALAAMSWVSVGPYAGLLLALFALGAQLIHSGASKPEGEWWVSTCEKPIPKGATDQTMPMLGSAAETDERKRSALAQIYKAIVGAGLVTSLAYLSPDVWLVATTSGSFMPILTLILAVCTAAIGAYAFCSALLSLGRATRADYQQWFYSAKAPCNLNSVDYMDMGSKPKRIYGHEAQLATIAEQIEKTKNGNPSGKLAAAVTKKCSKRS